MALDFAQQFRNAALKINAQVNRVAEEVVVAVGQSVVEKSVVGDASLWTSPAPAGYEGGQFKGSWHHSMDAPSSDTSATIDASGESSMAEIRGGAAISPIGKHYITNNLPYALRVERGYIDGPKIGTSHLKVAVMQAPVGRTEVEFAGIVREVVAKNT